MLRPYLIIRGSGNIYMPLFLRVFLLHSCSLAVLVVSTCVCENPQQGLWTSSWIEHRGLRQLDRQLCLANVVASGGFFMLTVLLRCVQAEGNRWRLRMMCGAQLSGEGLGGVEGPLGGQGLPIGVPEAVLSIGNQCTFRHPR